MANSATAIGRQPKIMSSRLMTMKFMQRAAASVPSESAPQPDSSQVTDTPSPKRRKLSQRPNGSLPSEAKVLQAALAAEETKREEALQRQSRESGETKWVLSIQRGGEPRPSGPEVYDQETVSPKIDGSPASVMPWQTSSRGRRSFGKFNKSLERRQPGTMENSANGNSSNNEDNGSAESNDGDNSDASSKIGNTVGSSTVAGSERTNSHSALRAMRSPSQIRRRVEAKRLAERERRKEVNLNRLSSISGGGGLSRPKSVAKSDMECYRCGRKGHVSKECPARVQRQQKRQS